MIKVSTLKSNKNCNELKCMTNQNFLFVQFWIQWGRIRPYVGFLLLSGDAWRDVPSLITVLQHFHQTKREEEPAAGKIKI